MIASGAALIAKPCHTSGADQARRVQQNLRRNSKLTDPEIEVALCEARSRQSEGQKMGFTDCETGFRF